MWKFLHLSVQPLHQGARVCMRRMMGRRSKQFSRLVMLVLGMANSASSIAADCRDIALGGPRTATLDLGDLVAALAKLPAQGEFESTAEFDARASAYLEKRGISTTNTVFVKSSAAQWFRYDANKQVARWSARTTNCRIGASLSPNDQFMASGDVSSRFDIEFCIEDEPVTRPGTPFRATNGFGVAALVTPMNSEVAGFFIGRAWYSSAFVKRLEQGFQLPVASDKARVLKQSASLVWGLQLRRPYRLMGSRYEAATVAEPTEWRTNYAYIVGNLRCLAVTDHDGRVIAKDDYRELE